MASRGAVAALAAWTVALALAGCGRDVPQTATVPPRGNDTAVLGGHAPGPHDPSAPLTDARGVPIPAPPLPAGVQALASRSGEDAAVAIWVQQGHVYAAAWTREAGWTPAQPLEEIYGTASDAQLVSNGRGVAMAVWRHTVGSIQSLRFSRFDQGAGWSRPDVMPGALPRADGDDAPRLEMDASGNVTAQWASGFRADEIQAARYVDGKGWTRAASAPAVPTPSASPVLPAPSSAR